MVRNVLLHCAMALLEWVLMRTEIKVLVLGAAPNCTPTLVPLSDSHLLFAGDVPLLQDLHCAP